MKDERQGVSKDKMIQGAKENAELMKFIQSLSKEEIERIKQVRDYDLITPGTPTHKIAVLCDSVREDFRQLKSTLSRRLWIIDSLRNNMDRLEHQLEVDRITEEMKNGVLMNKAEVKSLIQNNKWTQEGEFHALYKLFGQIRGFVGVRDVARNIIMTQEEFDKYVLDTKDHLIPYGYELFGELDE